MQADALISLSSLAIAALTFVAMQIRGRKEETRASRADEDTHMMELVRSGVEDIRGDVRELKAELRIINERGTQGMESIAQRVGVLETKMDVFWRTVAYDAAQVLHSPHEGRRELDRLLEAFRAKSLTTEEVPVLLGKLDRIRTAHAGDIVEGAEVTPGDSIAAALIQRYLQSNIVEVRDGA